jgi:hypothetical protein
MIEELLDFAILAGILGWLKEKWEDLCDWCADIFKRDKEGEG